MSIRRSQSRAASGYTLVELLVVVMIAILLMAIALPMAKTVMEDARPREASRILNTMIVACKARAAATGRLAGVEFVMQRLNDPNDVTPAYQCTQMYMCEVPAMYMGDTTTAVGTVDLYNPVGGWYQLQFQDYVPVPPSMIDPMNSTSATLNYITDIPKMPPSMPVNSEDVFEIRFDHRGPWYSARRKPTPNQFEIQLNGLSPISASSNSNTSSYRWASFQVRRPPQRVGNPIELPRSTCIDMTYSGVGQAGVDFNNTNALRVMFAPAGNVHTYTVLVPTTAGPGMQNTTVPFTTQPQGTIHFLIGLTTKVYPANEGAMGAGPYHLHLPDQCNALDGNALWVSISRQSGVVTTNENNIGYLPANPTSAMQFGVEMNNLVQNSRQFATARQQKGGR